MRTKYLIGKEVINSNASIVGKVIDIDMDFKENAITSFSLVVSNGASRVNERFNFKEGFIKSLNFKKEEIIVPEKFIETIGDRIILSDAFKYCEGSVRDFENDSSEFEEESVEDSLEIDDFDLDKFEQEIYDLKVKL